MTHLNEGLYAHHRGRGNTKATMDLLVEAIKKLSEDVQLIKKQLVGTVPVTPPVTQPDVARRVMPAAKITSEEVISLLKTKVEEVVSEVETVSEEVEAELKALVEGTFAENDVVIKPPTTTSKKKTK
jgi:gas vesicle protein